MDRLHKRRRELIEELEGVEYGEYLERVVERFCNAEIGDTVSRLCANGSTRQPKFVLPAIRDALSMHQPVEGLALELALWCHYCRTAGEASTMPALSDPLSARLREGARDAAGRPRAFLEIREVFHDLAQPRELLTSFARWLVLVGDQGVRAAIRRYVRREGQKVSSLQTSKAGSS